MEKNIGKVKAGMKFVFWYSTGNVEGRVLGFEDDSLETRDERDDVDEEIFTLERNDFKTEGKVDSYVYNLLETMTQGFRYLDSRNSEI